jgi:GH24 family phage-related lysozyme (muramidase)
MRASVQSEFVQFTAAFEGSVNFMYLDVKGLVTTGVGNLIDPMPLAVKLPWTCMGTRPASVEEISEGWLVVKGRQDLKLHGGMAYKNVCPLRLAQADISALVQSRLENDEWQLRQYFPGWDSFCADAQLGILSMAWAMGPNFPAMFPAFTTAANAGDWLTAGVQSHIKDGAPERNDANQYLFAQAFVSRDPELLHWPRLPTSDVG